MSDKAVLFDLDGTLTDSSQGIFRCFRHAFVRLHETGGDDVALPGDDDLRAIVGPPLRQSFARYGGAADVERLMTFYRERYETVGAFENRVYDGVFAALDRLRDAGVRLFVATSKTEADARRILMHFQLADRFESINGARADGSRSAKREIIGDTLATHALTPAQAVMIGDRSYDVEGARALDVPVVGALWGYGSRDELKDANALAATPEEAAAQALEALEAASFRR
jgi:phosphoglycolate phosphatase